jgi:4'-phosphopantetheinyl transferase
MTGSRVHLTTWPTRDLSALVSEHDVIVCCARRVESAVRYAPGVCDAAGARNEAVVRNILGAALGVGPRDVPLCRSASGKPYLAGERGARALRFNVSHSAGVLALALSRMVEVGVDVERDRAVPEWRRIAARVFDARTRAALLDDIARGERPRDAFLRHWCRMEAVVKSMDKGLFDGTRDADARTPRVIDLSALPFPAGDGRYHAALATC